MQVDPSGGTAFDALSDHRDASCVCGGDGVWWGRGGPPLELIA